MGRVVKVLNSGTGYVQNTYGTATLNFTVLQQIGPDSNTGSGDTTKTKLFFYDGLGRLTSVCEVTSSTGGTCGGGAVQSGAVTSYVYDPLNSVLGGQGFLTPEAQLGAFNATYTRANGNVYVTVTNPISLNSLLFHAPAGLLGIKNPTTGHFHTVHQTLYLVAPDPCQ